MISQDRAGEARTPAAAPGAPTRTLHMVAMRDGVRLATDVYLPDCDGPFPVVLQRTPYGRSRTSSAEATRDNPLPPSPADLAARFAARGYAYVVQDCRGRHDSEGEFVKYLSDGEDGADTCHWLIGQPWCNGQICTIGLSYDAHAQAALACFDPPGLVAQILDSGGLWNAWKSGSRAFGVFEIKQVVWAMSNAIGSAEAAADPEMKAALEAEDIGEWLHRLPWSRGRSPLRHHPKYEDYLLKQWDHDAFDAFWQQPSIWLEGFYERYSRAACVHLSGWYDPYVMSVTRNYAGLKKAGRGPQHLILGAFTHGRRSGQVAGDVDFGREAPLDSWAGCWHDYRIRIFDRVTRGLPIEEPPVRYFLMGGGTGRRTGEGRLDHGGRWHVAADWPPLETRPVSFNLHADGRLDAALPARPGRLPLVFDPAAPVPTIGGSLASLEPLAEAGGYDQVETLDHGDGTTTTRPLKDREDVLVFESDVLAGPLVVAGPVTVELLVSTNAEDADFTAKLLDIYPANADYPNGYALNLTDGVARLRFARDLRGETPIEAGEIMRVQVVLPDIANRFAAGHRMRIDISASNYPKYEINRRAVQPAGLSAGRPGAIHMIHIDPQRPSSLVLAVVPDAGND